MDSEYIKTWIQIHKRKMDHDFKDTTFFLQIFYEETITQNWCKKDDEKVKFVYKQKYTSL